MLFSRILCILQSPQNPKSGFADFADVVDVVCVLCIMRGRAGYFFAAKQVLFCRADTRQKNTRPRPDFGIYLPQLKGINLKHTYFWY